MSEDHVNPVATSGERNKNRADSFNVISCDYCGDALPMVKSRAHIPTTPDIQRLGFDAEKVVCPECVTRARAVQGEPNDAVKAVIDRDVAIDAIAGGTISVPGGYGVLHGDDAANIVDAIIGHATVPDAVTEARIERWMQLVGKGVEERLAAEAERDAALARIAEAAELHRPESFLAEPTESFCKTCQRTSGVWPCLTAVALGLTAGGNDE